MTMHLQLILVCTSSFMLAACVSRTRGPEPTSQPIVAETGGTVRGGSHDIAIPASALAADTVVTLTTEDISAYPPLEGARPEVLRIDPEGTVLERPATLTIHAEVVRASAADRVSVAQLAPTEADAGWLFLESERDVTTGSVVVDVTRFAPLAVVVQPAEVPGGAGRIDGTLSWGDGSPAAGAPVQLFFRDAELVTQETDAEGRFSFSDLEPGFYSVVVRWECDTGDTVELGAGEAARLDLVICG